MAEATKDTDKCRADDDKGREDDRAMRPGTPAHGTARKQAVAEPSTEQRCIRRYLG